MFRGRYIPLFSLYIVFCAQLGPAQLTSATISGTIKDETGAILPGAAVIVRNVETGITRTTVTDERGRYYVPNLAPGSYEIQAELTVFQTGLRSGIKLTVGREAIVDFALKVGEITEKVVVTGEAPLVETTSATVAGLVDEKQMQELPLNGRDYMQLAKNQQGVLWYRSSTPSQSTGLGAHFGGRGARQPEQLLDGWDRYQRCF